MLRWAVEKWNGPVAIRYPRGTEGGYQESDWNELENVLVKRHRSGKDVTFVTYGTMLNNVMEAADLLSQSGIESTVLRLLSVSNLSADQVLAQLSEHRTVIMVEEICSGSGIREALAWELHRLDPGCRIVGMDLGRDFVPHGSLGELYRHCGLDSTGIAAYTREVLSK